MKIFNLDSPLMRFLEKLANLMIINILVMICSIPIFTVGASLTAAHYVALKMVRDEDTYIVKSFFKSFKENFKQATILWLILLGIILILAGDFYIIMKSGLEFGNFMKTAVVVAAILVVMASIFLFPALAKFDNTIKMTIRNAVFMSILQLPKTALMAVLYVAPVIIAIFWLQAVPVVMMLGIAVPIYLSAMLYNKFFQKLEDNILERQAAEEGAQEEEEDPDRIFSDKLDEALVERNGEGYIPRSENAGAPLIEEEAGQSEAAQEEDVQSEDSL